MDRPTYPEEEPQVLDVDDVEEVNVDSYHKD